MAREESKQMGQMSVMRFGVLKFLRLRHHSFCHLLFLFKVIQTAWTPKVTWCNVPTLAANHPSRFWVREACCVHLSPVVQNHHHYTPVPACFHQKRNLTSKDQHQQLNYRTKAVITSAADVIALKTSRIIAISIAAPKVTQARSRDGVIK